MEIDRRNSGLKPEFQLHQGCCQNTQHPSAGPQNQLALPVKNKWAHWLSNKLETSPARVCLGLIWEGPGVQLQLSDFPVGATCFSRIWQLNCKVLRINSSWSRSQSRPRPTAVRFSATKRPINQLGNREWRQTNFYKFFKCHIYVNRALVKISRLAWDGQEIAQHGVRVHLYLLHNSMKTHKLIPRIFYLRQAIGLISWNICYYLRYILLWNIALPVKSATSLF